MPSGIYQSTLANCQVGDDCLVQNVRCASNIIIEPRAVLFDVGHITCKQVSLTCPAFAPPRTTVPLHALANISFTLQPLGSLYPCPNAFPPHCPNAFPVTVLWGVHTTWVLQRRRCVVPEPCGRALGPLLMDDRTTRAADTNNFWSCTAVPKLFAAIMSMNQVVSYLPHLAPFRLSPCPRVA